MKRKRIGKIKTIFTIIGIVAGGVVVSGIIIGRILQPRLGLLSIETNPNAEVFIDGENKGMTPYEEEIKAGNVLLRLVPEGNVSTPPYETTLTITPGVKTIVRRTLGSSVEDSSGIIVSFDKTNVKEAGLAIISEPDNANVLVDTNLHSTPLKIDVIESGPHQIILNKFGYQELALEIQAELGHTVTLRADLAQVQDELVLGDIGPQTPEDKATVTIVNTPTGFLRVRAETSIDSPEVGRLSEGDKPELLEESEDGRWYKIVLEGGQEGPAVQAGWISTLYASPSGELSN
jgi:hypothetical protein